MNHRKSYRYRLCILVLCGFTTAVARWMSYTPLILSGKQEFNHIPFSAEIDVPMEIASGPGQPEMSAMNSINPGHSVDPFSGDFSYTVPLLDVGGFPVSLSYSSGRKMEEEATMVGLGWNVNVGFINRELNGIPDDFAGDKIDNQYYVKPDITISLNYGVGTGEIFGVPAGVSANAGLGYNSYKGWMANVGVGGGLDFKFAEDVAEAGISGKFGLSTLDGAEASFAGECSVFDQKAEFDYDIVEDKLKYKAQAKIAGKKFALSSDLPHKLNFMPTSKPPLGNVGFRFKVSQGTEIQGWDPRVELGGTFSAKFVALPSYTRAGYGMMHLEDAPDNAQMDFKRENEDMPDNEVADLSPATYTPDVFNVCGIGSGGAFRVFRNDFGTVHDPQMVTIGGTDMSLGAEIAAGSLAKIGANLAVQMLSGEYGCAYEKGNYEYFKKYRFRKTGEEGLPADFEPWVLREVYSNGESHGQDEFAQLGGYSAVNVRSNSELFSPVPSFELNGVALRDRPEFIAKRAKRNQFLRSYTAEEATALSQQRQIISYPLKGFPARLAAIVDDKTKFSVSRMESAQRAYYKPHHLSEMQLVKEDGMRYIFSTPVYTLGKKERYFNVSDAIIETKEPVVQYDPEKVAIHGTGYDEFYQSVSIPGYAHGFLLNSIVSSDYSDLTGNGPSPDDAGTYTRINYTRSSGNYKWRIPYMENTALYNPKVENERNWEFATNKGDDVGSVFSGERELWYVESMESKNYEAVFYYSPRKDGIGVKGEQGGMDWRPLKAYHNLRNPAEAPAEIVSKVLEYSQMRLDSVVLFSRAANRKRLKKVCFQYDYSLCKGLESNVDNWTGSGEFQPVSDPLNGGKLTLKKVWIEYGDSKKGALNSFEFSYGAYQTATGVTQISNPQYSLVNSDAWGNYKAPESYQFGLNNRSFPYKCQRASEANTIEAAAWNLTKVMHPHGNTLTILYEPDDYYFVQNADALVMTPILGTGADKTGSSIGNSTHPDARFLFFKIPLYQKGQTVTRDSLTKILDACFENLNDLYASMSIQLKGDDNPNIQTPVWWRLNKGGDSNRENRFGLLYGIVSDSVGWLDLNICSSLVRNEGFNNYREIRLAAYKQALASIPYLMGAPTPLLGEGAMADLLGLFGTIENVIAQLDAAFREQSIAGYMDAKDYCESFRPSTSFLRLQNPYHRKIGGDVRVKKLIVYDSWKEMNGDELSYSEKYAVDYDYTTTIEKNGKTITISSGVATNEPQQGYDECALLRPAWESGDSWDYVPEFYNIKKRQRFNPLAPGLLPQESVGYSRVTIRQSPQEGEFMNTSRYAVNEYYTAKDYPIQQTGSAPTVTKNGRDMLDYLVETFTGFYQLKQFVSQGFKVHVNNMHGKVKRVGNYVNQPGEQTSVSETRFYYKDQNELSGFSPDSKVKVVYPDGSVNERSFGVNYDLVLDHLYLREMAAGGALQVNVDLIYTPIPFVPILPVVTPIPLPDFGPLILNSSISATKLIYSSGILDSIISIAPGERTVKANVAFDAYTGSPITQSHTNEFNNKYYHTTIPAHWVYEGMGQACISEKIRINVNEMAGGYLGISNGTANAELFGKLLKGDEMMVYKENFPNTYQSYWIWEINPSLRKIKLMDVNGRAISFTPGTPITAIEVKRSARKNLQDVPAGEITTGSIPFITTASGPDYAEKLSLSEKIINAKAYEYSEQWQADKMIFRRLNPSECRCTALPLPFIDEDKKLNVLFQVLSSGPLSNRRQELSAEQAALFIPGYTSPAYLDIFTRDGRLILDFISKIDFSHACRYTLSLPADIDFTKPFLFTEIKAAGDCNDPYRFTFKITYDSPNTSLSNPRSLTLEGHSECVPTANCTFPQWEADAANSDCSLDNNTGGNPYLNGILGNWRLKSTWVYDTSRVYLNSNTPSEQGYYSHFNPFWNCAAFPNANRKNWETFSVNRTIDASGKILETTDALGMPSANLFGYNNSFITAAADNTLYRNVAIQNFEDTDYRNFPDEDAGGIPCHGKYHWFGVDSKFLNRYNLIRPVVTRSSESHSGKYGLSILSGAPISIEISTPLNATGGSRAGEFLYRTKPEDIIGVFNPEKGKKYQVNLWVKVSGWETMANEIFDTYKKAVNVLVNGTLLETRSTITDGWQQVSGIVDLAASASEFIIRINSLGTATVSIDDMRVLPEDASMQSYVYDPFSLKLTAELDEYNFATFYQYDEQGNVTRKKVETEKGIITTEENIFSIRKLHPGQR